MRYILIAVLLLSTSLFAQTTNDLIIPRAAAPRVIVPVAGNTAGANGTFYRSDISVINLRNATQRIHIFWYPLGTSGSLTPIRTITLPPQQGTLSDQADFVGEILQTTGLGGLEFVGVTEQGAQAFRCRGGSHLSAAGTVLAFNPDEAHVFRAKAAASGKSVYSVVCEALSTWAKTQPEYVNAEQVGTYVQGSERTGVPVHPSGKDTAVRVRLISADGLAVLR